MAEATRRRREAADTANARWNASSAHRVAQRRGSPFPAFFQGVCELLSRVRLFVTPWTVAHQAPLSMGFSRQEYWSGLPSPSPEDVSHPGIKP